MIRRPGCRQHLRAGAARPLLPAAAVHVSSRPCSIPWALRCQPCICAAVRSGCEISGSDDDNQQTQDLLRPIPQSRQQLQRQGNIDQANPHHQQPQQQQQQQWKQQHWMLQYIRSPRLAGALMVAALLALLPGIGKHSAAVAATLPPPWQITTVDDKGSSSSSGGSSSSMQFPLPVQDLMLLSSTALAKDNAVLVDAAPVSVTAANRTGSKLSAAAADSASNVNRSNNSNYSSSSSSDVSQRSAFSAPSSISNSSSTAVIPAGSSSSSAGGSSSSAGGSSSSSSSPSPAAAVADSNALDGLLAYERATVNLFAAALPSVVNITHMRAMQNFYTLDIHHMAVGQGSGFIWDNLGHVVTNYHVIKGASEVKVTLHDHSSCTARVVGWDERKDIAVLKLALPRGKLEALRPVTLGSSSSLRVGQSCFAIGNPFGLDHTLTQGIVSGLGRELSTGLSAIKNVIQTDAAINPGNSGGVLLNSQGYVIGVNLGILDPSGKGSFSGVGFAIPIDTVKGLVEQILAHGRVRRPSLGITIAPGQVLSQLGTEGVLVLEVPAGTPAAAAGLRATYRDVFGDIVLGDIIVGMDTRPIRSTADLIAALDERRPGDKVRCDVLRDGKRLSMTVALGERGSSCE